MHESKAYTDFFETHVNNRLVLILDMGMKSFKARPILFEKSLKLLATLSQLPSFTQILTTTLNSY